MNLQIISVRDAGDFANERIVFSISEDQTDVGKYIVLACPTFEGDEFLADIQFSHWFADKIVGTGDLVVLYSKAGEDKEKKRSATAKTYFFYWGLERSIWGDGKLSPVLLNAPEWQVYDLGTADKEPETSGTAAL